MSPISSPHSLARSTPAHDLPDRVLGKPNELDLLGHGQGRELLAHEVHDVQFEHLGGLESGLEGDEGLDYLHVHRVGLAHHCRLGHRGAREGPTRSRRADQVAGGVDHVVVAATNQK